jgi:tetratricopeptide (TPR) repeat protein
MGVMAGRVKRNREKHQQVTRAWELALLRQYREALRRAWRLLPEVRDQPELHGRCVAVIAHTLDELAAYEAATVAFDYLLERLPDGHPMATRVRLQHAAAAFAMDHLADGDDALRKLRPIAEERPNSQISAAYTLARLIQDVRTGHFAEAAEHAEQTAEALRPLGVEAGYGHGLLAYCCDQLAGHEADAERAQKRREAAARWWRAATILLPPAALSHRFAELGRLAKEEGK